jgi:hypothetical protein
MAQYAWSINGLIEADSKADALIKIKNIELRESVTGDPKKFEDLVTITCISYHYTY